MTVAVTTTTDRPAAWHWRALAYAVILANFAVCTTSHAVVAAETGSVIREGRMRSIDPLSAETMACGLIDRTFPFPADRESRAARYIVAERFARTPAGHRHLRGMLDDPNPSRVEFALTFLSCAPDFGDVPRVVSCAQLHLDSDAVVRAADDCLSDLLGRRLGGTRGTGRKANEATLNSAREWLESNRNVWAEQNYADYWASLVDRAWNEMHDSDTDANEAVLNELLFKFLRTTNAVHAAPHMVRWMAEYDLWAKRSGVLPVFIRGLQLYVGPLDIPRDDDIEGQRRSQQAIVTWWQQNRSEKPVLWLLRGLARRGYATDNPADVGRTSQELVRALKNGASVERYAAGRVLSYVLPNGDGIPFDDDGVVAPSIKGSANPPWASAREYLREVVLCRAIRWSIWDRAGYTWNAEAQMYSR